MAAASPRSTAGYDSRTEGSDDGLPKRSHVDSHRIAPAHNLRGAITGTLS